MAYNGLIFLQIPVTRRLENVFVIFAEHIPIKSEMAEDLFASYFICSQ